MIRTPVPSAHFRNEVRRGKPLTKLPIIGPAIEETSGSSGAVGSPDWIALRDLAR
jgi:hypothetical protein